MKQLFSLAILILSVSFITAGNVEQKEDLSDLQKLSSEQIAQIHSTTQQRKLEFFTKESGKPLVRRKIIKDWNNRGDFTRHYAQSIALFAMRACVLNEQLNEANEAIQELSQYHLDRPKTFFEVHSFPGVCDALSRLYTFYGTHGTKEPGRLSEKTCAILEKTMWEWANEKANIEEAELENSQSWWISHSENHHAQHYTTCWSFSRILKDVEAYKDKPFKDGHLASEHYTAWTTYLKEYIRQRACKGMFIEINSPSYASATLKSFYSFYDFTDDPVLKKRAGQLIELYWALWAQEQLETVEGGAMARCYLKSALRAGGFIQRVAWYVIGEGNPEFVHTSMLPFVTSTWLVPDMVLQIAAGSKSAGEYEISQRRMGLSEKGYHKPPNYRIKPDESGILRYSYCTPDFIMGSLMTEARPTADWAAISSQNRWSGVIFDGDPDARVFPAPFNAKGTSIYNGFWSVQAKGTMISQRLSEQTKGKDKPQEWRVFFSTAGLSEPVQKKSWVFSEAKNAYIGVCVVQGKSSFEQSNFGQWLVCEDNLTPIIIEVGRKSDYADFSTFQKKAMNQPFSFEKSMLSYKTLDGDTLTFYCDQSRLPKINNSRIDLAPKLVFDSPFVQSKWNSGVVTIKYGQDEKILNFND